MWMTIEIMATTVYLLVGAGLAWREVRQSGIEKVRRPSLADIIICVFLWLPGAVVYYFLADE